MKKVLGGLFIVCIVIVALLAVIELVPYFAEKKNPTVETVVPPLADKQEPIVGKTDAPENQLEPNPTTTPAVIAEPATDQNESAKAKIVTEPSISTKIDTDPTPADKTPWQPVATTLPVQADSQPPPNIEGQSPETSGLLTDTTETTENQLMDPQSTQVAAASSKSGQKQKTRHGAAPVHPAKETINLEIAVTPQSTYPYSILLETFDELANAQQNIALYRKKRISSYWVKANLGSAGVKYRLFAGMFPTETAAQTFLDKHQLTGKLVKDTSYAAQIGVFRDTKELASAFFKTSKAGVFPYILGTENGPFFLYVGAFYTADGAESQCRELMGKELPCKVVIRSSLPPKS